MITAPKSTINSEEIRRQVEEAARKMFPNFLFAEYENGWWVWLDETEEDVARLFRVVDAEGPGTINGFGFEEV